MVRAQGVGQREGDRQRHEAQYAHGNERLRAQPGVQQSRYDREDGSGNTNPYRPADRLRGGGEPRRHADGQYAHAGKMKERKRDTM
jgi:hypothetical protein